MTLAEQYFAIAAVWMAAELCTKLVDRDWLREFVREHSDLGTPVAFGIMIFSAAIHGLTWPYQALKWLVKLVPPAKLQALAKWLRAKAVQLDKKHQPPAD